VTDLGTKIGNLAKPLVRAAGALEAVAILGALFGALGGVAVAMQTSTDVLGDTTYPYVALGVGIVAAAVVQGVFLWCVARALKLYAVSTAARYDIDIDPTAVAILATDAPVEASNGTW
jgi:hypothetical protein